MPVTVGWLDNSRTVIQFCYEGTYSWGEFHQAASNGLSMIQSVRHTVHIVVDALASKGMPAGSPFPHLKQCLKDIPSNIGTVVIISQKMRVRMTLGIACKFYGGAERFIIVGSEEEAHAILKARIGSQKTKDHLIHAMSSNSRPAVLRAIEELRERDWLYDGSLNNINLSAANLPGVDLFMGNMAGSKLQAANLENANLFMINFEGANIRRANLHGASLVEANLSHALATEADFSAADLTAANLQRANLRMTNFCGANLYGAALWGANLHGAIFDTNTVLPDGRHWSSDDDLLIFIDASLLVFSPALMADDPPTLPSPPRKVAAHRDDDAR